MRRMGDEEGGVTSLALRPTESLKERYVINDNRIVSFRQKEAIGGPLTELCERAHVG